MLHRLLRLSRKGFEHARTLKRTSTAHFGISYGSRTEHTGSAVVVPKKAIKSAVTRHLLKRRIRSVLILWSSQNSVLIVTARTGAEKLTYTEIEQELSGALTAILG